MFAIRIGYAVLCFVLILTSRPMFLNGEESTPTKPESEFECVHDTESVDRYGEMPLHRAVRSGDDALLLQILEKNRDVNRRNIAGFTALDLAAWHGNERAVALLLKHGAKIDPSRDSDRKILFQPCKRGQIEIVRLLLEHGADQLCDASKNDPSPVQFHFRSQERRYDAMRLRIAALLVKKSKNEDWDDLALTVVGSRLPRLNFVWRRGPEPSKDDAPATAKRELDLLLVEKMIDIDKQGRRGETILLNAVKQGDLEIVRKILEKGADPNIFKTFSDAPLEYAVFHGVDMVRLLLGCGAEVNPASASSPLVNALLIDDEVVADLLWEKGARFDVNDGSSMEDAVLFNKPLLVKRLLENGVSPTPRETDPRSNRLFISPHRREIWKSSDSSSRREDKGIDSDDEAVRTRCLTALLYLGQESKEYLYKSLSKKLVCDRRIVRYSAALAILRTDPAHRNITVYEKAMQAFNAVETDIPFTREISDVCVGYLLLYQMIDYHYQIGFTKKESDHIFSIEGIYADDLLCELFFDAYDLFIERKSSDLSAVSAPKLFRRTSSLYRNIPPVFMEKSLDAYREKSRGKNWGFRSDAFAEMEKNFRIRFAQAGRILPSDIDLESDQDVESIVTRLSESPGWKREFFDEIASEIEGKVVFAKNHLRTNQSGSPWDPSRKGYANMARLFLASIPEKCNEEDIHRIKTCMEFLIIENKPYSDSDDIEKLNLLDAFENPRKILYDALIFLLQDETPYGQEKRRQLFSDRSTLATRLFIEEGWFGDHRKYLAEFVRAHNDHFALARDVLNALSEGSSHQRGWCVQIGADLCTVSPEVIPVFEKYLEMHDSTNEGDMEEKYKRTYAAQILASAYYRSSLVCHTLLDSQDVFDYCAGHQGGTADLLNEMGPVVLPLLEKNGLTHENEKIRKESQRALTNDVHTGIIIRTLQWHFSSSCP